VFLGEHVLRRADHGKRETEVIQRAKHPRKNHRIGYVRAVPRHEIVYAADCRASNVQGIDDGVRGQYGLLHDPSRHFIHPIAQRYERNPCEMSKSLSGKCSAAFGRLIDHVLRGH